MDITSLIHKHDIFRFDNCNFNPKNEINKFILEQKDSYNTYYTIKCYDIINDNFFHINPFKFFSGDYYASIQKLHDRQDANNSFERFNPITYSKFENIRYTELIRIKTDNNIFNFNEKI